MLESAVERKLCDGIKKLGGRAWKWVSPGHAGVPDRIVTIGGRIWFVELKTDTGRLTELQKQTHGVLRTMGCDVRTLYGVEDVKRFLVEVFEVCNG